MIFKTCNLKVISYQNYGIGKYNNIHDNTPVVIYSL